LGWYYFLFILGQTIVGFGGSFSDASVINLLKMDESIQQSVMGAYFGPDGLGYSLARVPVALKLT
jgi:glucosylceramidase